MTEALSIESIHTHYYTGIATCKAVRDVSLTLQKGETLGLAGETGSGKTTLAMSILRLIQPPHKVVKGSVMYKGTDLLALSEEEFREYRWKHLSLVMQAAMYALNPMLRISDQMIEPVLVKDLDDREGARNRAKELLEKVGIESNRIDNYPHEFSEGMKQRVMIAMSLILDPSILILDEPTTALDVVVQHRILNFINDLKNELDISLIWITHDLALLSETTDRIAIMYGGRIMEIGNTMDVILDPKHPYTQGLIASVPTIDRPDRDLTPISGAPPDLVNPPPGCPFYPRCQYGRKECKKKAPNLRRIPEREGGWVTCQHLIG